MKKFLKTFQKNAEIPTLWYNGVTLDKGDTVVEIGALSGNICCYSWKAFGVTDIYAVEVLPQNYKVLVQKCKGTPVKTINVAIGETNGEVNFAVCDRLSSCSLSSLDTRRKNHADADKVSRQDIRVRSVTMQKFMQEHRIDKIDFLIMNCEGAELFILEQIINSEHLINAIRGISVEFHPTIIGRREVLKLVKLMYPRYDYRVITRLLGYGPINVIFSRREASVKAVPCFYFLRCCCGTIMDVVYPTLRLLKREIARLWRYDLASEQTNTNRKR